MKNLLLIIFSIFTFNTIAAEKAIVRTISYVIKSDKLTNDLPTGQTRLKGFVSNYNGEAVTGVLVSTIDESISVYTDNSGAYELIVPDSDSSIFIYKKGYEEVAIDPYDFKSGHTIKINFALLQIEKPSVTPGTSIPSRGETRSYKPVIYLYSTTIMQVSLALDYLGELTFTYPKYNEGWNVNVDENGIHAGDNEKSYPYLFWEGEMEGLAYETEDNKLIGELIATDTLVEYLETQLSLIGLNRTEQADFITFWAPRMIAKDYVFVQFLVDDLYTEKVAELTVSPKPESMKRVYLLYTQLDENPQIEFTPQVFNPFNRKGFTLIEWGGSEITIESIQP